MLLQRFGASRGLIGNFGGGTNSTLLNAASISNSLLNSKPISSNKTATRSFSTTSPAAASVLGLNNSQTQAKTVVISNPQLHYIANRSYYKNQLRPDTPPASLKGNGVIAIRREDKNRWERRAPLAPPHVATLVSRGIQVVVQPSSRRVFSDEEYRQSGAVIQEDISVASTILGVKEVPRHLLIPERTYMFFSHTIKAQPYNMPLLDEITKQNIRLLDYERVVDDHNNRLIRFGKFAGYAGMIDFLHGLGNRLLAIGHSTPFLHLGFAHMYSGLENAYNAVFAMGREIANQGLPAELSPMIFVFTGTGASSQGAQEVFRMLPHKYVSIDELPELVANPQKADRHVIYAAVASSESYIVPKEGSPTRKFSRKDYYTHPEKYRSVFHEKVAPYMSCLINCVYWDVRYPRLLTTEQMEELERKKNHRLIGVADISCDLEGSVEFLKKTTTIDHPLFLYDVKNRKVYDDIDSHEGIMFLAVDNLPSELPREASKYFGDHLMPWLEELATSDGTLPITNTDLPGELQRAVITSGGKLTPAYEYIANLRAQHERARKTQRILILGSGFVVQPIVDYLARFPRNFVTIASMDSWRADILSKGRMNVDTKTLDVLKEKDQLSKLIYSHDIIISLVPAKLHSEIAKECIKWKKNMVTASYISPEMKQLDEQAKEAGVTILNEVGLDPGIDHLSALQIINNVKEQGGKIIEFTSWCGGLPAPEASDNPLAYKFSWSPRGVLAAVKNPAVFRVNGKTTQIPSGELLRSAKPVHVYTGFNLEGYPNRDSLSYMDIYGISDAKTVLRGTLRYSGFSEFMQGIHDLGLLDETPRDYLKPDAPPLTWRELLEKVVDLKSGSLEDAILNKLNVKYDEKASVFLQGLKWLEMLSDRPVRKETTLVDSLCSLLQDKLKFEPNERDLVILHHIFRVKWEDGREEKILSTLVQYGENGGYTAMAKTVGIPTAIATKMILDGTIIRKGVIGPFTPDIYIPLLSGLEKESISMNEKSITEFL